MDYRVTVSYPIPAGQGPGEPALEQLRTRLDAALPEADPRVALSAMTLDVALTVRADQKLQAINRAVRMADGAVGDASIRADAQPATVPGGHDE